MNLMKKLKNILLILCLILVNLSFLNSCGAYREVSVTNNKNVVLKDSILIKDSTRVVDSIIYVQLPKEKVMDIIKQIDTSKLETSLAKSIAYVDTNSLMIIHSLENKDTVIQERIVYQDKFVEKEKIVYRDTLETREIPVEVIVEKTTYPKTYWYLVGFFVLVVGWTIAKIIIKIKTGGIL